jgi:flagellar motor switch protein FliG
MIRAGKGSANGNRTAESQRTEIEKAIQAAESTGGTGAAGGPTLLGDEIVILKNEALEAWADLGQYPYLATSELREWLVAGGGQTQKFVAVMGALGPVESVKLLQKFSPNDLAQLRKVENIQDSASKLPGYSAILQLHRSISTQILNRPDAIIRLDFPELVKASDEALASGLVSVDAKSIALCFYILPEARRFKIIEAVSAKMQRDVVEGFAALDGTTLEKIDFEISSLKTQLIPNLEKNTVIRFAIAEEITQLMDEVSPKTRASLQEALSLHKDLDDQINARMVTFDDVLSVDDETLGELLDEFSPEQVAVLLSGVRQEGIRRIAKVLPRKVAITVEAELARISSRQATLKRARNQSLEYQTLLRDRLKDLVEEGVVELDKGELSKTRDEETGEEVTPGTRESA